MLNVYRAFTQHETLAFLQSQHASPCSKKTKSNCSFSVSFFLFLHLTFFLLFSEKPNVLFNPRSLFFFISFQRSAFFPTETIIVLMLLFRPQALTSSQTNSPAEFLDSSLLLILLVFSVQLRMLLFLPVVQGCVMFWSILLKSQNSDVNHLYL